MNWASKIILTGALVFACTSQVRAAATLSLYDGINPLISVSDNGPGDQNVSTGGILVRTNVGVWYLSISSAVTKPLFGSATDPVMNLIISAYSSSAGSLSLTFSDNFFGPSTGTLNAFVDGHLVSGAPTTVTYDVYGDPANVIAATTVHLASTGTSPLPTSATGLGPLTLGAPFSLTQIVQLQATGATGISANASFNVTVPEPGVVGLGALGLFVLASRKLRPRKA